MAKLVWGASGARFFETGLDKGVFFLGAAIGVPWNGLISIDEKSGGASPKPVYLDGRKILNLSRSDDFEATVEAFFTPTGFEVCDGNYEISNGLFATQQPRQPFALSYRTLLGNDTDGTAHAYKIHLVYNVLATSDGRNRSTIGDQTDPTSMSWTITTLPEDLDGFRPTAHFIVDSRTADPTALSDLEDILYGSSTLNSRMPTVEELVTLFGG